MTDFCDPAGDECDKCRSDDPIERFREAVGPVDENLARLRKLVEVGQALSDAGFGKKEREQ